MSVTHVRAASRRVVARLVLSAAVAALASPAFGQVSSLSLNFDGTGGGLGNTGFDAAYNPNPSGYNVNFQGNGKLGIATLAGDTYGDYEDDPDSAQNFFYTNFNVGDRAVLTAHVNLLNLNADYHGGGIWMGTDEDHYVRLGIIHNGGVTPNGPISVEALRETEDRWDHAGLYPNRPNADIESRYLGVSQTATVNANNVNGSDLANVVLKLVRDHHAVACYASTDNGATFTRIGGDTYSFNALATDALSLPIDNRTAADPNNTDLTSHTVEGGFKVGAYAIGGGSSPAVLQVDQLNAITGTPTYTGAATGEWTLDSNWNSNNGIGAPINIESTAVLPSTASARNLTVSSDIVLTNVHFDSAAGTTISGTGNITLDWFYFPTHPNYYTDGPGTLSVTAGNHTISAPTSVAHLHNFDIAGGTSLTLSNMTASPAANPDAGIHKLNTGTLIVNKLLTSNIVVDAGTLQIAANGTNASLSTVNAITVSTAAGSTAKLDITNNALVLDYAVAPATSPLAATAALIKSGYNNGSWNGAGIISSAAAADSRKAVGFAEATALGGTAPAIFGTVDTTAVLIRETFKGDANLDGTVNFGDLVILAQNYDPSNAGGKTWVTGDFNYDGNTNFNDLVPLAQNYNLSNPALTASEVSTLGGAFASDFKLAQSFVPEPTSLAAIGLTSMLLRRRRKA